MSNRLRLTILGGFLGAGKSTWLRHQLHAGEFDAPFVVVNEIADIPVDEQMLGASVQTRVLCGACACCSGRDALIVLLREICNQRTMANAFQINDLILETTGVADPARIVEAIQADPVLARHIMLDKVVVILDAVNGIQSLLSEDLARRQLESADSIIFSKVGICAAEPLSKLVATVLSINPDAALSYTDFGVEVAPPDLMRCDPVEIVSDPSAPEKPISTVVLNVSDIVICEGGWATFSVWFSSLLHARGHSIIRAKGVLKTPAGRLLLQSVRNHVGVPEIVPADSDSPEHGDSTFVLIGRDFDPDVLQASLLRVTDAQ